MESIVAGVGGTLFSGCWPSSVGRIEEANDCVLLISLTGGGLHKSYSGSPDEMRISLLQVGAMIAAVTIA